MVSSHDPFQWLSDLQRSGMKRSRIESPGRWTVNMNILKALYLVFCGSIIDLLKNFFWNTFIENQFQVALYLVPSTWTSYNFAKPLELLIHWSSTSAASKHLFFHLNLQKEVPRPSRCVNSGWKSQRFWESFLWKLQLIHPWFFLSDSCHWFWNGFLSPSYFLQATKWCNDT